MNLPRALPIGLAVVMALAAASAAAQTLYKLIDKNGKVTYSEKPPKDFDGKVVPLDIDPARNTATLPRVQAPPPRAPGAGTASGVIADPGQIRAARERVEAAKQALKDAQDNPAEADVDRIGKAGGGARPVLNDTGRKRIEKLEEDVRRAEEQLRRIEGS